MGLKNLFQIPVRLFSRSSSVSKAFAPPPKKPDKINIEDSVKLPVEEDPKRLLEYVCGTNILEEGGEDVKIKQDSEYPDWLWKIRSPVPLEEMDKNSKTYWNRIQKYAKLERKYLNSLRRTATVHK